MHASLVVKATDNLCETSLSEDFRDLKSVEYMFTRRNDEVTFFIVTLLLAFCRGVNDTLRDISSKVHHVFIFLPFFGVFKLFFLVIRQYMPVNLKEPRRFHWEFECRCLTEGLEIGHWIRSLNWPVLRKVFLFLLDHFKFVDLLRVDNFRRIGGGNHIWFSLLALQLGWEVRATIFIGYVFWDSYFNVRTGQRCFNSLRKSRYFKLLVSSTRVWLAFSRIATWNVSNRVETLGSFRVIHLACMSIIEYIFNDNILRRQWFYCLRNII